MTAALVPKTLFGEKYVDLQIPKNPSSKSLKAGDEITQTKLPIEVERVLNDLYPLLRAVQPAELNYTLNALAGALEGRGDKIGESLVTLNSYLKRLNPQIPALIDDLKLLTTVTDTYADVVPQLAETLRNSVKTGNTLVSKQQKLHAFLRDLTSLSNTTKTFLDDNGDNIIRLGQLSEPILALLARYSSTFPCLLEGIVKQAPRLAQTFRGFIFHINLKVLPQQPRGYTVGRPSGVRREQRPELRGPAEPADSLLPSWRAVPEPQRRSERTRQGRQPAHRHRVRDPVEPDRWSHHRHRGHCFAEGADQLPDRARARRPGRQDVGPCFAPLRSGHGRHGGERGMSILDKQTRGDLVKLTIFIVVTTLATGVLVVLIGNLSFESTRPYKAVFSDATGVVKGDDIRIAGVKVGSVKDVKIVDRTRAEVSFSVAESSIVTKSSTATIRYRNLVGQRYISLTQGVGDLTADAGGLDDPDETEPSRRST